MGCCTSSQANDVRPGAGTAPESFAAHGLSPEEKSTPAPQEPEFAPKPLVSVEANIATENKVVEPLSLNDTGRHQSTSALSDVGSDTTDDQALQIRDANTQGIVFSPEHSFEITPEIGFIIKTKNNETKHKVFINVLYHNEVHNEFIHCGVNATVDKKGQKCMVYSVVVPGKEYPCYVEESDTHNEKCIPLIEEVAKRHHTRLSKSFIVLRRKRPFIGDVMFTVVLPKRHKDHDPAALAALQEEENKGSSHLHPAEELHNTVAHSDNKIDATVAVSSTSMATAAATEPTKHEDSAASATDSSSHARSSGVFGAIHNIFHPHHSSASAPAGDRASPSIVAAGKEHHEVQEKKDEVAHQKHEEPPVSHVAPPSNVAAVVAPAVPPPQSNIQQSPAPHAAESKPEVPSSSAAPAKEHGSASIHPVNVPPPAPTESATASASASSAPAPAASVVSTTGTATPPRAMTPLEENLLEAPVFVPPKMHGWLKKRGHIIQNWKTRYFVLDSGYITYYVDKLDTPPFGKDMKGQLCLAGYREKSFMDAKNSKGAAPNASGGKRVSIDNDNVLWQNRIHLMFDPDWGAAQLEPTDGEGESDAFSDLLLEASTTEEKLAWLAAIQAHTNYIEVLLTRKMFENKRQLEDELATATGAAMSAAAGAGSKKEGMNSRSQSTMARSTLLPQVVDTQRSKSVVGGIKPVNQQQQNGAHRTSYSNFEDTKRWLVFMNAGENLVFSGLTGKPNPVGIHLPRQLLLTSARRFVYIDPKTLEVKGEILWAKDDTEVKKVAEDAFEVVVSKKKVYRFIMKDGKTADDWMEQIRALK